jgi:hypothetical protein
MNQFIGRRVSLGEPAMFLPPPGDETKLGPDETIFGAGEDARKLAVGTHPPNETTGRNGP